MSFNKKDLMECAYGALAQRRAGYPTEVRMGRLRQKTADEQISKMEAIYRVMAALPDDFIHENQGG
jgi:hypothetical protein